MQVPGSPRLWLAAVPVLAAFAVTGLAVVLAEGEGGDGEDAGGAIESFQLPRERGGCAGSIGASIGHRDPRGFPVLDRARLVRSTMWQSAQERRGSGQPSPPAWRAARSRRSKSDLIYLVETRASGESRPMMRE